MAGISHVNVGLLPEPRLINGQQPGTAFRRTALRRQRIPRIDPGRAASQADSNRKKRDNCCKLKMRFINQVITQSWMKQQQGFEAWIGRGSALACCSLRKNSFRKTLAWTGVSDN